MTHRIWTGAVSGSYNTSGNFSPSGAPVNGDYVHVPAGAPAITADLDATAVTLAGFFVYDKFQSAIGSKDGYLKIKTSRFEFAGDGLAFIDLSSQSVSPRIVKTAAPTGNGGLFLLGSAIATLDAIGGNIAVVGQGGETATVTNARNAGANLFLGEGLSLTNLINAGGDTLLQAAATTITARAGTLTTWGVGAITTLNISGAIVVANSTGTITTCNLSAGELDTLQSMAARTISALNQSGGTFKRNRDALTVTTETNTAEVLSCA